MNPKPSKFRLGLQLAILIGFNVLLLWDWHFAAFFIVACFLFPPLPIALFLIFDVPCSYGRLPRRK